MPQAKRKSPAKTQSSPARRVAAHRQKASRNGLRRLDLAVPSVDAPMMRGVAAALREGGKGAEALRAAFGKVAKTSAAKDSRALLAFFRNSPLVGLDLDFPRDKSTGRPLEF